MKLTELDTTTDRPPRALPPEGDVFQVARLPLGGERSRAGQPPPLVFVTEEARPGRVHWRAGLLAILVVLIVALLWVLVVSGPSGGSTPAPKPPVRLSPAAQRAAAAARARAAAIAQAKRDRGTDAELQDTIPPPVAATAPTRDHPGHAVNRGPRVRTR